MRTLFVLLLLAGCSEPPVQTEEPGVRPYGHVEFCNKNPEHRLCQSND